MNRFRISDQFRELQREISVTLEDEDGMGKFSSEEWSRAEGGGGITRVMVHGNVFEKAGVNFSAVEGTLSEKMMETLGVSCPVFFATGVSIVIHPYNPFVPIIHMNVRYFEMENGTWWFGGGIDLTPHYIDDEEARIFHEKLKDVCDRFDAGYYPRFSEWADDYFFIPHRNETRGIGGIFFDRLCSEEPGGKDRISEFVFAVGKTFAPLYCSLVSVKKNLLFGDEQKQWQMLRRGRYVEFNLIYDKGTKFGLETNGRIESILVSLPENVSWIYDYQPLSNSDEKRTMNSLKKGKFRLVY